MAGFARELLRAGNRFVVRISVVAALGGFLSGYDTGVISGAVRFIKGDLHAGELGQQWVVGSLLLGEVTGAGCLRLRCGPVQSQVDEVCFRLRVRRCLTRLGVGAVSGLALAAGMLFVPHTPRWLMQAGQSSIDPNH